MLIVYVLVSIYVLWLLFVMFMGFYAAWPRLPTAVRVLAMPAIAFAYVFDVAWNWTLGTLLFLQRPPNGTYTFTQRLSFYRTTRTDWRASVAKFVCTYFLDVFQTGHC